ncbi:VASCULAR-RELATED UNKNOWN PROTEIN 4 [Hibiscus trionum]|uniref:Uncharacterized protein n=1 Tax=Hibiscus trionum TaxID=183268 RepID=A0A9W7J7V5_HIBTR|nr:VASCULAR-RELATED UNKNOWN PROTEIN 4 [Hibiscus trionum]
MDSMSRSSSVPPCYDDETPEESSWTMYFKDFSNDNDGVVEMNGNGSRCYSISDINYQTSSLVSGRHVFGASSDHNKGIRKNRLCFKKRKTNRSSAGFVDDDLEDTASSPVDSPKMCNMENQSLKMKDAMDTSKKDKGSGSSREIDERNDELGFIKGGENEETQLKKRGLCLVPLSMVLQYLG